MAGTAGVIEAKPGAVNVIPQDVSFTIDVRSGGDTTRRRAFAALRAQFSAIAEQGIEVRHLPSGAGHDAMVFPAVCPRNAVRALRQQWHRPSSGRDHYGGRCRGFDSRVAGFP